MPSVLERLRDGLSPTFTVERELASGGMGTVFLGRDHALDRHAADAAWLWYENLDAVGWPSTVAQACEVDWAVGTYARWRRARLADSTGARIDACRGMADVAAIWAEAEPAYGPLVRQAGGFLQQCSR